MQETTYDIIQTNSKTLIDRPNYTVSVQYAILGNYKIVTLYYLRKVARNIATGSNLFEDASNYVTSAWRPSYNCTSSYARVIMQLTPNGQINTYATESLSNYAPNCTWTYIVPNNQI